MILVGLWESEVESFYSATVLGSSVYVVLWCFLIYAVLGVVVEMMFCLGVEGVLESRSGLLFLPLRPVYGAGGAACTLILHRFIAEPIRVFLLGTLICSVVEYLASFAVEKVFGTVSWDYRDKLGNLQGRICLQYSLCWGLLALVVVYVLDPVVFAAVHLPGRQMGEVVLTVLMALALLSGLVTLAALARTRRRVAVLQSQARGRAVTSCVTGWEQLIARLVPDPVIINTFPRMSLMTDLMRLTGQQRAWLRWPRHRASPPQLEPDPRC